MTQPLIPYCVSFTGHRPEGLALGPDETTPRWQAFREDLRRVLIDYARLAPTMFICGMAQGSDIICGEEVLAVRRRFPDILLSCVLPYRNHGQRWPAAWRNRHNALLEAADSVECLSDSYFPGCYHQRNRYLVDDCDALIAIYDGRETGGTAYTVQYARKLGREVVIINPADT